MSSEETRRQAMSFKLLEAKRCAAAAGAGGGLLVVTLILPAWLWFL